MARSSESPTRLRDALDLLAERGEAAFATDSSDRIVLWNSGCEKMLGFSASEVLGKHCFDVMAGRTVNGNLYCFRNCPVAYQIREARERPVRTFTLLVNDAEQKERRLSFSMFAMPAAAAALASVIHVLREGDTGPSELDEELRRAAEQPASPPGSAEGLHPHPEAELTAREREILLSMAEGLGTAEIASRLSITAVTVRNHTQSILQKLHVHTKLAAVVFAFRHNLI